MSDKPHSLHKLNILYIMNLFSFYENEPKKADKWENIIIKYGYIPLEELNKIDFLDDISITLKVFPKEYRELKEIDETIQAEDPGVEITEKAFDRGSIVAQLVYNKECARQPVKKDKRLLPPYLLLWKED